MRKTPNFLNFKPCANWFREESNCMLKVRVLHKVKTHNYWVSILFYVVDPARTLQQQWCNGLTSTVNVQHVLQHRMDSLRPGLRIIRVHHHFARVPDGPAELVAQLRDALHRIALFACASHNINIREIGGMNFVDKIFFFTAMFKCIKKILCR